jgi:PAS domain S-box-containing protein
MRATNEGLWDWDLLTNDVYFSPRWKEMIGYGDEEIPHRFEEWERRVHPNDLDDVRATINAYLSGVSTSYEVEHRLAHKDGTYRWICARGVVICNDHGEATRFVGSHADISERKSAEQALRQSRSRYQDLVNTIDGIVWEADASTMQFTFVSEQAERLIGYPSDHWLGETTFWHDHLHPDDQKRAVEFFDAATAEKRNYELEYRMIAADGRTVWLRDIVTVVIENDVAVKLRGVMVDIARQKKAEQQVHRRDDMLEAVRFAAERFLNPTIRWDESVNQVLERLGCATGVSRVFIFENYPGPDGEVWATYTHEWVASNDWSVIDRPQLKAASYTDLGVGRWAGIFRRGESLHGHVRDLPASERQEPEAEGTLSYTLVPIFVNGEWWGLIGFDECVQERDFSAMEHDALKAAADTLGAALGRRRVEEELRESQRSLSTLLSNLPGMAYRCRNQADWRMEFISDGSVELTGYQPHDLVDNRLIAYADLIHPKDRTWVWQDVQAALAAGQPIQVTYRIITAAGAQKWVMEQGRGVKDENGHLEALEGIVTDVTDRVHAHHRLEQRVDERTRELATLLNVSASVASTLELQPLLSVILDQFEQVVDHCAAAIFSLDGEHHLRLLDYRGPMSRTDLNWIWSLSEIGHSREVIRRRKPVIIPDVRADTALARAFRDKAMHDLGEVPEYISSWMGVPLIVREKAIGLLAVDSSELDAYTPQHAELALAFATHAAVAIENARLYEEAQGKAVLEERQRLARELHDSVSQALFGIGLGARTARTLLDQDPANATAPLDYVLSLAEAGLTEMRALIFELRPEALEQEGLAAALEKQVAALRARYGIEVKTTLVEDLHPPAPVQEALYRIAQEGLHNTVKHAHASAVELSLDDEGHAVILRVADNGKGFDASGSFPGHLGLRTMRERAESLGGTLRIASSPGSGTRIQVEIPLADTARRNGNVQS